MKAPLPWLAPLLAAMSAIGPFAIDTYLPAFPAIAASLGASALEVQQTLTAYMLTFALMVLWHGALADAFGRRRVAIVAHLLFMLSSLLCAFAPDVQWLWAGRALQGMSAGAGMVIARAIVRDVHTGAAAQRLLAQVMMIFGIAPAIAPVIGGALLALSGWRGIFVFLALWGALLAALCWRLLPETLPPQARRPLHPHHLWRAYRHILSHRGFLLVAGAGALNFNGFFIYVLSAPVFVMQHLGLGEQDFAWMFVPAVCGMVAGSWLSGWMASRSTAARSIATGFVVMAAAAAGNLMISAWMAPALPWSVLPIAVYNVGMGLAMPALTLLALDLFPERRGLAASCQSLLQVGLNALTASTIAPLLWTSPFTLALAMAGFLLASALAVQYSRSALTLP